MPTLPELAKIVEAYNNEAPNGFLAEGDARNFRMIHPTPDRWRKYVGYQFTQKTNCLIIFLYLGSNGPASLANVLSGFDGKTIGDGKVTLVYEDRPSSKHLAALTAKFPLETPSQIVAAAMRELISLTRADVEEWLTQKA
jgi:hypothetical protein